MDELRKFLNSLSLQEQENFARRCGTSRMYLRKVASKGKGMNPLTSIKLEIESGGAIHSEAICPDFDWGLIRTWATGKRKRTQHTAQQGA